MNEHVGCIFDRTKLLIGHDGMNCLQNSTVAVFGIGGVGSFATEALARAGVGHLVMVDFDNVDITNVNRQIHAFSDVVGNKKVDEMAKRVARINPDIKITTIDTMYNAYNAERFGNKDIEDGQYEEVKTTTSESLLFDFKWDYVIDAIDMVSAKLDLIQRCYEKNIPIISSMGTGNKLHPEKLQITDIYKTHTCPLAKVMRRELKKRGVKKLTVCFSDEEPMTVNNTKTDKNIKRVIGSTSFVPPVAGMICAGKVIRDLVGIE